MFYFSVVKACHATDKEELISVSAVRETRCRDLGISLHLIKPPGKEGIVCGRVKRILYLRAETRVLLKIRVCQYSRELTFRIFRLQSVKAMRSHCPVALAHIQQPEMIISLIKMLIIRIMVSKAAEHLLTEPQIVQFILEYYAGIIESVLKSFVACLHLFRCHRYLRKIIFSLVRIVLRRIHTLL